MTRSVWKYPVPVDDRNHVFLVPSGQWLPALHVDSNADIVTIYAEVEPEAYAEPSIFRVFGTGQPIPDGAVYMGTTFHDSGLVWHLYETSHVVNDDVKIVQHGGSI